MKTGTTFTRHYFMPMPWRGSVVEIPEEEVPKLLADEVNNVRVQGADQSLPLSVRTPQDLAEFKSFETGRISPEIEDQGLARDLLALKQSGVRVYGHFRGDRGEIGAYGAYNAVAGAIGVSLHSATIGEGIPDVRFWINSRENLDFFLNQVKFVEDLFVEAPISKEAVQRGRHTLHKLVQEDQYYPRSLGERPSVRDRIEWFRNQAIMGERALRTIATTEPNARLALRALRGASGKYDINIETSRALIQLGFENDLKPLDFLSRAADLASPPDKKAVTTRLAGTVLSDHDLKVPRDILEQAKRGELSAQDIREVVKELQTHQKLQTPKAEENIETKEDLVIIGGEALEVDL